MIDWGSAPAWASAILTSGSFALGFYVLLRDRRKEERSEASLVVCWRVWSNDEYETHIHNASKRTVVDVNVLVRVPHRLGGAETLWEGFGGPSVLRRDAEETVRTPRRIGGEGKWVPQFVTFQDADGIFWIRDLVTGQLERLRTTRADRGSMIGEYLRGGRKRSVRGIRDRIVGSGRSEKV
jgi:hypothetical protein